MDIRQLLQDREIGAIELDIEDGDIVTDVVVLVRCQRLDTTDDMLEIGCTEHTGGITQFGIIGAANLQVSDWMVNGDGD